VLTLALSVATADEVASKMLADAHQVGERALATVQWLIDEGAGEQGLTALGTCVKVDGQGRGILLVPGMNPITPHEFYKEIRVHVPGGGQTFTGELIGVHEKSSLGLGFVRVAESYPWEPVTFAERSGLSVGSPVASAALLGMDLLRKPYTGMGMVNSAIELPEKTFCVSGSLTGSGSPVFDAEGRAVGLVGQQVFISTQLFMQRRLITVGQRGQHWTMCFVPVEEFAFALQTIPETAEDLSPSPWLGAVHIVAVPEDLWEINQMTGPGVKLHTIAEGAAADKAGLMADDIVTGINGEPLQKTANTEQLTRSFTRALGRLDVGDVVELDVLRNGQPLKVSVALGTWPPRPNQARKLVSRELGMLVREKVHLDRYVDKTGSGAEAGLLVLQIGKDSPAQQAGLLPQDTIKAVAGEQVTTTRALQNLLEQALIARGSIDVTVSRGGEIMTFTVRMPQAPPPGAGG